MKSSNQILLLLLAISIISCKQNPTGLNQFYPDYKVAFISLGSSGLASLNMFDVSGNHKETLLDSIQPTMELDWSYDTKFLIYTQLLADCSELYIVNKDDLNKELLLRLEKQILYVHFSHDGEKILFTSENQLFTMNKNGGELKKVTNTDDQVLYSAWYPNENKIIFSSRRTGNYEIYSIDVAGENRKQITSDSNYNHIYSSLSSDGKELLLIRSDPNYHFWQDTTKSLIKLNLDNQNTINLDIDSFYGLPAWSPDASKIVFQKPIGLYYHLFIMDYDGSNQMQITKKDGAYNSPKWIPDGSGIIAVMGTDFYFINNTEIRTISTNSDAHIWAYAISPQKIR